MKLPKGLFSKTILSSILLFGLLFAFTNHALAYIPETGYTEQFNEGLSSDSWEKSSFDYTTINNVMESLSTAIIGTGDEGLDQKLGSSALGTVNNLVAGLYEKPPVSSLEYFADLGQRLKITKPAYAQGIGFEGLGGATLEIWKTFRNVTYLIFAIIIVFLGLAIMFRFKLNPQTVINFQNSLPKIIVALILVTFSYAIAGFLIDFMYIIISLFAAILKPDFAYNQNLFGAASTMFGSYWDGSINNMGLAVRQFVIDLTGSFGKILGYPAGTLAKLIFAVAILFSLFKLFFTLIIAYVSIIAGVIFSPFLLMLEAVPGQKGLMNWLKLMATNIVPFPIVAIIFMIGSKLIEETTTKQTTWVAPFLGTGSTTAYIPTLIGFALILATPTVIASAQKSLGTPGIAGIASGIVTPIATAGKLIATPITYPASRVKAGMEKSYEQQVADGYSSIRGFRSSAPQPKKQEKTSSE